MVLRPTIGIKVPRICHSDPAAAGEESAFLHSQKQILRRFAPQNDKQGVISDGASILPFPARGHCSLFVSAP